MEKMYQIALTQVEGIGSVLFRQLISYCGSAEAVFKTKNEKLIKIPGIGNSAIENIKNKDLFPKAEKIIEQAERKQVSLLFSTDKDYPFRLRGLYDAPAVLYFKGKGNLSNIRSVGIVGTRQATDYGKRITEELVARMQIYNPLIVSGLAYGIDISAHKASLENGLPTIAVMASGLDVIYPSQHEKYIEQIIETGGIISEHPFGMQPMRNMFLSRNRIIAGLSDAVVVVESAKKGGAMVTAEFANNYHKDVFAVPGNLVHKSSEGCNKLIKENKAHILTSVDDIIELLNWDLREVENPITKAKVAEIDLSLFSEEEITVISLLKKQGEMQIDEISWLTQININRLASLLLNLEFQGIIKAMVGKKFGLR